jgi:hypothetical protein
MPEKIFDVGDDVLVIVEPDTGSVLGKGEIDFEYSVDLDRRKAVDAFHIAYLEKLPCTHWVKKHGYELRIEAKKIDGKRFLKVTPYYGGHGRSRGGRIPA